MRECRAQELSYEQFMNDEPVDCLSFYRASVHELIKRKDGKCFNRSVFKDNLEAYKSDFLKFATHTDIFLSCHYWDPKTPGYLEQEDFEKYHLPIRKIGDITCDINGSIKSTTRSTTHDELYYDFNPVTSHEEKTFSSPDNITVIAVDTCPNVLAMDASK